MRGDVQAACLFQEYAEATYRKQRMGWSDSFRDQLEL